MTRALGTVVIDTPGASCVASSLPTTRCLLATVSGVPDGVRDGAAASIATLTAHLKITDPTVALNGTLVLLTGGDGASFWEELNPNSISDTLADARAAGYRIVQVEWASSWMTGTAGALALAGRPASLLRAIYDDSSIHTAGHRFVVAGNSAGASALAYALGHYGASSYIDAAILCEGPTHARLDWGTLGAGSAAWNAIGPALCTTGSNIEYVTDEKNIIDASYGRTYCADKSITGGIDNPGVRDSILRVDTLLAWPQTDVTFVFGDGDVYASCPLGRHFKNQVSAKSVASNVTTGGVLHGLVPNSTSGMALIDAAVAAATFNH